MVWNQQSIESLIADSVSESSTLDFKRDIPGRDDKAKAELLKDVTSLANASGGSIIYGIAETKGRASQLTPCPDTDTESQVRRLSQIIDSGIEPKISGLQIYALDIAQGFILVIEVPDSHDKPHRYSINGNSRFVIRNQTHTSDMSYIQLRSSFLNNSARISAIRREWESIQNLERIWVPIFDDPICVVNVSPIAAGDERQLIDPKFAYENWEGLINPDWEGGSRSFNYEGLVVHPGIRNNETFSYIQVHRNGHLTAYRTAKLLIQDRNIIPSVVIARFIRDSVRRLISNLSRFGIRGGAVVNACMTRLQGYGFACKGRYGENSLIESKYATITLPESWIDDLTLEVDVDELVRPGLDLIWQSYGKFGCDLYDAQGKWVDNS